jgi:SAM-dependent methyltransferase
MSWTSGYVADIDYTHGYYRELNPLMLALASVHAGLRFQVPQGLRYLELGFGQGLSLNIHAAALGGEFWGVDLNPSHAAQAQEMARASGSGLRICDSTFEEFAARQDLPTFDVIALHGVWSWISEANRLVLIELIRRQLATGGIVYVSYNTMPGWSAASPLRELLTLHAKHAQGDGDGLVDRINASMAFAQQLHDADAIYFKSNPSVADRLRKLQTQNRQYLAHEYFNADWQPMSFATVHAAMDEAKLSFVSSANMLDHIEAIHMTQQGLTLLGTCRNTVMRETVRDYLVNQQFRRDLFVRGPRRLSPMQRLEHLRPMRFALCATPDAIAYRAKSSIGEVKLDEQIYRPLIEALQRLTHQLEPGTEGGETLAGDPCFSFPTLAGVEDELKSAAPSITSKQLIQALAMLIGLGHVSIAQAPARSAQVKAQCDRLNSWIVAQALEGGDIVHLASPVTGGGINVSRFEQLFLHAQAHQRLDPKEQARYVWDILASRGQRLVKEGKSLEGDTEHLLELEKQALAFKQGRQALLTRLGVSVRAQI